MAGATPGRGLDRAGRAGLGATAVSITLTFTVAVLGPSVMESALPGRAGQPPWAFGACPSPYLVLALAAAALAAGTLGLALTMRAARRGWPVSPRLILLAGLIAAAALAFVPPIGTTDHLSYAAYGRMVVTGHDPYTTTPAALARLGDPFARLVHDWRTSPSAYGSLGSGGQALAALIGGTSVRLTVFVLSLLNVAAFAATGMLLHRLARGDRPRQLRAALLWTCNPLLLQVLVAGQHIENQAILFGVAALAVFTLYLPNGSRPAGPARPALAATGAGALIGLGFAVQITMLLVGAGLALACVLAWRAPQPRPGGPSRRAPQPRPGGPSRRAPQPRPGSPSWRGPALVLGSLAAGFAVTAGASLTAWGPESVVPALRAGKLVSVGSPWRTVRSVLHQLIGEGPATALVKAGAAVVAVVLLALLVRSLRAAPAAWPSQLRFPRSIAVPDDPPGIPVAQWAAAAALVFALTWLIASYYLQPWYDSLAWALLVLLPWSSLDWLLLARTSALAFGYLPTTGSGMPAGLGWLVAAVRTAVTPVILLGVTVALVMMIRPARAGPGSPAPSP
jgi:hypothetical protein